MFQFSPEKGLLSPAVFLVSMREEGRIDRDRKRSFSTSFLCLSRLLLVLPLCLMLGACASAEEAAVPPVLAATPTTPPVVPDAWKPLMDRLVGDGLDGVQLAPLFASLGDSPSQDPMGRKVQELYTNAFLRKPRTTPPPKDTSPNTTGIPRPWYKGVVTDANARLCRDFIHTYEAAFSDAEKQFGVPPDVAAALLFVETRLGGYLGSGKALPTLASMSATRSPDAIPDWLVKLPGSDERVDWIRERMELKSDWAYNELKALLTYSQTNGLAPSDLPCSVYGAIGLCQFMPSNIGKFGQDGDNDGVIDLFNPPDAVFSLSSYLHQHGWKRNLTVSEQIKVLRKYNNLGIYANTILALASKIRSLPLEVPAR